MEPQALLEQVSLKDTLHVDTLNQLAVDQPSKSASAEEVKASPSPSQATDMFYSQLDS